MHSLYKILCTAALLTATAALAQTYDLPIIFIDTKQKCLNKDVIEKIPATMSVLDGATNNVADSAKGTHYDIGIKVRGQSSALFPKPGYSVEVRGGGVSAQDERDGRSETFHFKGGIIEFVKYVDANKDKINAEPIYVEGVKDTNIVEVAMEYTDS